MNKLFVFKLSLESVIIADNEDHVKEIVMKNLQQIVVNDSNENKITPLEKLPENWDKWCLPWGGEDDKSLAELLINGKIDSSYIKAILGEVK